MTTRVFSLNCIVPPHMLREIALRGDPAQRAWAIRTLAVSARMRGRREVLRGFGAGAPPGGKRRAVYDARKGYELPGLIVREEGSAPARDPAVNEAYDGAGATYDLYREVFERDSLDGRGMRLDATVHYGREYDNAFWDGSQMVYGDGDGRLFRRFTAAVDVIGHELTHGVVQYEAALDYRGQPGALNESFADVFGALAKQHSLGQTAKEGDWVIGRGLFTEKVRGEGIRSMKAPGSAYDDPVLGRDPQPAHMKEYVETDEDGGGVHINSGIPNHAFYRVATALGGHAWERAGRIWYVALRDRLRRNSGFERAAALTLEVAEDLFGAASEEARTVRRGWEGVGVEAGARPARRLRGSREPVATAGRVMGSAPLPRTETAAVRPRRGSRRRRRT